MYLRACGRQSAESLRPFAPGHGQAAAWPGAWPAASHTLWKAHRAWKHPFDTALPPHPLPPRPGKTGTPPPSPRTAASIPAGFWPESSCPPARDTSAPAAPAIHAAGRSALRPGKRSGPVDRTARSRRLREPRSPFSGTDWQTRLPPGIPRNTRPAARTP